MQVHARISSEWRRRMIFMFLMIFGSGVWFLSDGYLMWPAEAKRHGALKEMADAMIANGKATSIEDPAVVRAWKPLAASKDWPEKLPKERTAAAIAGQRWTGVIGTLLAAAFAAWVIWNHKRSVRAEGDLVIGASGERVHFDSIVGMDRGKWADKGIAYAIYMVDGKQKRLTLDDHKFLGCEAIILEAEKRMAARVAAEKPAAG